MAEYDVVVVGSGFGGSVAALRLVEKGYRVLVLEAGRRFTDETLPRTSWDVSRFLWAPRLGWLGIQRIHVLPDVVVLAGAGVGGGSLDYANTLYRPTSDAFYRDPQWAGITDWRAELAPFYDQASRMLGVVDNPTCTPADDVVRRAADDLGVGHTFRLAPVGVVFGPPGAAVPDPFFGGAGPARRGCLECGECMTGCRHGAKNTLPTNYLYLAERAGARVVAETTVTSIRPRGDGVGGPDHPDGPARRRPDRHRRAGGGRRRDVGHAGAAAPDEGGRHAARALRPARRAHPHQQRVARRGGDALARLATAARHDARRRHHVVGAPRRPHPPRAGALRARVQPHGPAEHGAHRRRRAGAAAGALARATRCGTRGRSPRSCSGWAAGRSAPSSGW